jgi:hypothetical protein
MIENLITADIKPYGWLNEAQEALERRRADAPLQNEGQVYV